LETFIGTGNWPCRYIRGRCYYACRTKRDKTTL